MAKSRKRSNEGGAAAPAAAGTQALENSPETESGRTADSSAAPAAGDADDRRRLVEQRAYELYLSRGGAHGSDWEDWLAAERELIANRGGDEPPKP